VGDPPASLQVEAALESVQVTLPGAVMSSPGRWRLLAAVVFSMFLVAGVGAWSSVDGESALGWISAAGLVPDIVLLVGYWWLSRPVRLTLRGRLLRIRGRLVADVPLADIADVRLTADGGLLLEVSGGRLRLGEGMAVAERVWLAELLCTQAQRWRDHPGVAAEREAAALRGLLATRRLQL